MNKTTKIRDFCRLGISFRNSKKAQITTFIIIGVVLLIIVGLIYFLRPVPEEIIVPPEAQPVKLFIDECLEGVSNTGIRLIARQGGYFVKDDALNFEEGTIAYGYASKESVLVSITEIEEQLARYTAATLRECIDLEVFEEQGYSFKESEISAKAEILDNKVLFEIRYPLEITLGDSRTELNRFAAEVNLPLGRMHSTALEIIMMILEDPEYINTDALADMGYQVNIIPVSFNDMVYSIKDKETDLTFMFAANYELNQPPILDIPDVLSFRDGEAVVFKVKATDPEDDPLIFSDDSALFDITQDGVILFTPEVPGEFDVTITVTDTHRNEVSKLVKFVIE